MRARVLMMLCFSAMIGGLLFFPVVPKAHAQNVTLYSQSDNSGEMVSQQPTFQNTWISSASLGNLFLGKDRLTITFTMKDPNASNIYGQPAGVALGTCATCQNLQKYYFTAADRTLLSDGAFHTFTIETGTTTLGTADGETPIYVTFFGLSQYHNSTHVKSNAAGTIPFLLIEAASLPMLPPVPQAPEGSVTIYEQSDKSGTMTNPQATYQNAHIDSASLGNLDLGKDKLYITFTIKDPKAGNVYHQPGGICIQPFGSTGCGSALQRYYFTDADRVLLADQAFHTFMVETGTTTSTYADGTRPVSIGFFNLSQYQYETKIKSNVDATIPYLIIQTLPPSLDPCATPGACASNVLFLPGIEGSRLYRPIEGCDINVSDCADHKLWDPSSDSDLSDLGLDDSGESVRGDVYVKEGDIVSSASAFGVTKKFYEDFVAQMNTLKEDRTMADWEPVAYDWRLSLPELLNKGAERGGKIFYEEATSTPYIEQTLRSLAASSKTKKVTIIAHSNGGLLAKALVKKLGASEAENLIDDIIFVGVPQSGAPQAVGGLLFGYGQALPRDDCSQLFLVGSLCSSLASRAAARSLAEHSPMAYHLLPSDAYFTSVQDPTHSVASFTGAHEYQKEQQAYGATIDDFSELSDFLQAKEGGRTNPSPEDTSSPGILNGALLEYAKGEHDALDPWTPPAGITLYQIAGWGVDTISGISFYESPKLFGLFGTTPKYRPIFVEDGDGVVPVPSALLTSTSTENVKRYWIDLAKVNDVPGTHTKYDHGDILEVQSLQDFIKNILNSNIDSLPDYISSSQPPTNVENKKLTFFLHSPLTLQLKDADGNITGLSSDGSISQDISGSTYGQFGEVKYIIAPAGNYSLTMHGQDSGTFSLDMQESSGGIITSSSTIANVPTTGNTLASLTISGGIDTTSPLTVDENGDGTDIITITPQLGETVNYEPPAPEPVVSSSGGGGGGSISTTIFATPEVEVATSTPIVITATTTQSVATTTPEATASTTVVQAKKPSVPVVASVRKSQKVAPKSEESKTKVPQTASVYEASQQPLLAKLGMAVYNGLHGFWLALKRFF